MDELETARQARHDANERVRELAAKLRAMGPLRPDAPERPAYEALKTEYFLAQGAYRRAEQHLIRVRDERKRQ